VYIHKNIEYTSLVIGRNEEEVLKELKKYLRTKKDDFTEIVSLRKVDERHINDFCNRFFYELNRDMSFEGNLGRRGLK